MVEKRKKQFQKQHQDLLKRIGESLIEHDISVRSLQDDGNVDPLMVPTSHRFFCTRDLPNGRGALRFPVVIDALALELEWFDNIVPNAITEIKAHLLPKNEPTEDAMLLLQ